MRSYRYLKLGERHSYNLAFFFYERNNAVIGGTVDNMYKEDLCKKVPVYGICDVNMNRNNHCG